METSAKSSSSVLKSEAIFEGVPPNQIKRRRTDYDLEYIPRAIYNDFYAELQLREEGFSGKINRSKRKIKQKIDINPRDIPESLNLFAKAINLPSMRQEESSGQIGATSNNSLHLQGDEEGNDERTVILTEAGIDILNFTYQNSIIPLSKPKIASPLERPIHYFDNNRTMFKPFEKTYRYGSLLNTLASTNYQIFSKCHVIGNEMDKQQDQNHRASTLRYKQNFKASESTVRARGLSFRGRGFIDVRKGWAKASEYTEGGFTGDISDTSYANETDPISFVKELDHPRKPRFTSLPITAPEPVLEAPVPPRPKENPKTPLPKSGNDEFENRSAPKSADRSLTEPIVSDTPTAKSTATRSVTEPLIASSITNAEIQEYRPILKSSFKTEEHTTSPMDNATFTNRNTDSLHQETLAMVVEHKSGSMSYVEDDVLSIDRFKGLRAPETSSAVANTHINLKTLADEVETITSPESARSVLPGDEEWLLEEKKRILGAFKAQESMPTVDSKPATIEIAPTQLKAKNAAPEKKSRFDHLVKKTMEKQQQQNDQDNLKNPSNTENSTGIRKESLRQEHPKISQIEMQDISSVQKNEEVGVPIKTPEIVRAKIIERPPTPLHEAKETTNTSIAAPKDIEAIVPERSDELAKVVEEWKTLPIQLPSPEEIVQTNVALEKTAKKPNRLNDLVGRPEEVHPTPSVEVKKSETLTTTPKCQSEKDAQGEEPVIFEQLLPPSEPKGISNIQITESLPPETVLLNPTTLQDVEPEKETEKKKKGFFKSVASAIKKSVTNLKSFESAENISSEKDTSRASIISKKSAKKDADTSESTENLSKEKSNSKVSLRASFLNLNKSGKSLKPSESLQSIPSKNEDTLSQTTSILDKLVIKQADSNAVYVTEESEENEADDAAQAQQKKIGPRTGRYLNAMAMASAQTVPLNEVTKEKTLKNTFRSSLMGLKSKSNMKSSESLNSISAKLEEPSPSTFEKCAPEPHETFQLPLATSSSSSKISREASTNLVDPTIISSMATETPQKVSIVVETPITPKPIDAALDKSTQAGALNPIDNSSLLPKSIPTETPANPIQSALPLVVSTPLRPADTHASGKVDIDDTILPPLPTKDFVNEKDAETWLTTIQKVVWKDHKCDLKVVDFELHCCESGKNKPYKPYLPLSLRRILRITPLKGSDVEIQCSVPRGDKEGSEFKTITLTFVDAVTAQKWRDNLIFLSFGGTYEETIKREILVLLEKSDKDSQKLVEKYMIEVFESSKRPCTVKTVQYNEFMVTNVLSSVNFSKIGNVILTNVDFVPRMQQVLVREQYSNDPTNLVCEKDPVDAAIDIIRSAVGKKKLASIHVSGLKLKRDEKGLFSSFRK